jgi:hypothetical protein
MISDAESRAKLKQKSSWSEAPPYLVPDNSLATSFIPVGFYRL